MYFSVPPKNILVLISFPYYHRHTHFDSFTIHQLVVIMRFDNLVQRTFSHFLQIANTINVKVPQICIGPSLHTLLQLRDEDSKINSKGVKVIVIKMTVEKIKEY